MTEKPVRVLVDLSVAPPGGAGTYAAGFMCGLADAAIPEPEALTVLVDSSWAPDHREAIEAVMAKGITVDTVDLPIAGTWKARLGRGRIISRAVAAHRVDLAYFPREVVPQVKVPYALLAHNLHAWTHYETELPTRGRLSAMLLRQMARRSARRAGAVMVVSAAMTEVMDAAIPIAAVVHHGCSLREGDARTAVGPEGTPRRVVMVCTLMANKRVEVVIDGVARARQTGSDWMLDVYGGGGEARYVETLERHSSDVLGASALRGSLSPAALGQAYRRADILVVGGTFESFCFPLVEAMRSGCVVVAPACALTTELCGDAAVTYQEGDPKSLADALERAWTDRAMLSQKGIERARRYTWAAATETAIQVTRALCTRSRAGEAEGPA